MANSASKNIFIGHTIKVHDLTLVIVSSPNRASGGEQVPLLRVRNRLMQFVTKITDGHVLWCSACIVNT